MDRTHLLMFIKPHAVAITVRISAVHFTIVQMHLPSLVHTLVNIPHPVPFSLTSTVMGTSLDWLIVHIPTQPTVECRMLLEFVAKGKLLQVSNCIFCYTLSVKYVYIIEYYYIVWFLLYYNYRDLIRHQNHKSVECYSGTSCYLIQH